MSENKANPADKASKKIHKTPRKSAPCRLWVKSVFTGFRRSKETQNENQVLLKIQGVNDSKSTAFYWGKRCAYIYKAHTTKNNTKYDASGEESQEPTDPTVLSLPNSERTCPLELWEPPSESSFTPTDSKVNTKAPESEVRTFIE
eukprot:CAMPEP_0114591744 /NCGR_PEP_ID=MMETSP0125-20121206/13715_1 /TAXON_ID=485358 ORGANISM="Aristerostoma sp., Strain ATCC 50986" /NCGR_SAMPLE_ID=MMETSP0125 /ASSEMBLY_ACC=CAM_ASM_000245 /LENGTH=144 /DNA_ID=CAMNT_0001789983 /DNA_START=71 /DNA_END=506 /DNA_ORIENTATION=-